MNYRNSCEVVGFESVCYLVSVVRGRKNPLYMGFGARLKKARLTAGYHREGLTQLVAVGGSAVLDMEQGQRYPRLDTVEHLARALSLSPGFLAFGLQDEASQPTDGLLCEGIASRLKEARTLRGLSMRALARAGGVSHSAVVSTESGATIPTIETAERLAVALGVSAGWLGFGLGPECLPDRRGRRPREVPQAAS